jgi:hypothetical protein
MVPIPMARIIAMLTFSLCATLGPPPVVAGGTGNALERAGSEAVRADTGTDFAASLTGVWSAPEERSERATPLDVSVFGPGAVDIRKVTLTISSSGAASLRVASSVVDRRGRRYSPSVLEIALRVGTPGLERDHLLQVPVAVVRAERKYLDGSGDRSILIDCRAKLMASGQPPTELVVSFDSSDGRDSFRTTLKRQRPTSGRRSLVDRPEAR